MGGRKEVLISGTNQTKHEKKKNSSDDQIVLKWNCCIARGENVWKWKWMCVCCFVSPLRRLLRCFAVFEYYCLLLLRLTEEPTTTAVHVEWFKLVTIYPSMRHSQNEIAWPFVASVVLSGDEFSARRSLKWWCAKGKSLSSQSGKWSEIYDWVPQCSSWWVCLMKSEHLLRWF